MLYLFAYTRNTARRAFLRSLNLDFRGFPLFLLLWDHLLVTAYTPVWQSVWRQRETAVLHCWGRLFWQCFCIHMPFYLTKLYRTWYMDMKGLVLCFYTLHPYYCILFCFGLVTVELHPMLIWNMIFPSRSYLTENIVLPFGTCCCLLCRSCPTRDYALGTKSCSSCSTCRCVGLCYRLTTRLWTVQVHYFWAGLEQIACLPA